jgi:hypothetical protein
VHNADHVMEALLIMPPDFNDPLDKALQSIPPVIANSAKVFRGIWTATFVWRILSTC